VRVVQEEMGVDKEEITIKYNETEYNNGNMHSTLMQVASSLSDSFGDILLSTTQAKAENDTQSIDENEHVLNNTTANKKDKTNYEDDTKAKNSTSTDKKDDAKDTKTTDKKDP